MNSKNLGFLLLAIYLITVGLFPLLKLFFPGSDILQAILAVATGVLLLLDLQKVKFRGNLGMLLLAIWLILVGLVYLLNLSFNGLDIILSLLAIGAGVLLLLKK